MCKENDNIENEAPNLFGIKKRNSFQVPKDYFEILEDNIAKKTLSKQGILNELRKKNSFNVPKAYFNELTNQIESKIRPTTKIIPLFNIKRFAYAASIIVLIMASVVIYNNQNKETNINLLASITPFEKLSTDEFFDEITDTEIELTGIVFETENLEVVNIVDFQILDEEIKIDPTELIELDSDFDLF